MNGPSVVSLRDGLLEDRIAVEGAYVIIQRWHSAEDPRDDRMVQSAVRLRFPMERWGEYRSAIERALQDAAVADLAGS